MGATSDINAAIDEPPYYVAQTWPIVANTQGGPVHDAEQRLLNPFSEVIEGLYAAGELGSVFGHLYTCRGAISRNASSAVRSPGATRLPEGALRGCAWAVA